MRPIWMRIKGLNSFLEGSEVDFERLTRQGLFGIFGPTGSGKSTILDGISLALYGTTARNSTNFINVNTDKASVEYIFSIHEKEEKKYQVLRSFKRSKEGTIRSDGAKILALKEDVQEVLADRVGTVNDTCREILGLSKEDFFRTVVLPQGKFSDFLKLEGMERNKMLERLFHLEQYGEELASLIKKQVVIWEGKKLEKEGALSRYSNVNENEILKLIKEEIDLKEELDQKELERKQKQSRLEEVKLLAYYQEEYEKLEKRSYSLQKEKTNIEKIQKELEEAEVANVLMGLLTERKQEEILKNNLENQKKDTEEQLLKAQLAMEKLLHDIEEKKAIAEALANELENTKVSVDLLQIATDGNQCAKDYQQVRTEEQNKEKKRKEIEELLKKTEEQKTKFADEIGKIKQLIHDLKEQKDNLEEKLKQLSMENMADILASNLKEGVACPVCGNIYHISRENSNSMADKKIKTLESYKKHERKLEQIKEQLEKSTDRFYGLQNKQTKADTDLVHLKKQLEELTKEIKELTTKEEYLYGQLQELKERYKIENIFDFYEAIQNKLKKQEVLRDDIKKIETKIKARVDNKEKGKKIIENYENQILRFKVLIEQGDIKILDLQNKIQEKAAVSDQWIIEHQMDEKKLLFKKQAIDTYKEEIIKIHTQIEKVKENLNGKHVSLEEVQELQDIYDQLEQKISQKQKIFGGLRREREQAEKDWEEKKNITSLLEQIYHKLDLLSELEGLFRGKRFVEYVSRYYLEYVSREADFQLRQMTGNSYGLETDGNGTFLIRDYKNGGVLRSASTLSGGETFMTSLALALSLSSQIQMKGAAPLELFFLDEGFGTLDENSLQIVMESLEKIRTKKRSVGVITHVEEIKNRIPIRLLVEPGKIGEGGSKIRIEEE